MTQIPTRFLTLTPSPTPPSPLLPIPLLFGPQAAPHN